MEIGESGYARKSSRMQSSSLFSGDSSSYEFRVLPLINGISSNQGGDNGNKVNITGRGFVSDTSKYTCSVAGHDCKVISADSKWVAV